MNEAYSTINFALRVIKNYGIPVNILKHPFDKVDDLDLGLRSQILKYDGNADYVRNRLLSLEKEHVYIMADLFTCNYIIFHYPDQVTAAVIGPFLYDHIRKDKFIELLTQLNIPAKYDREFYDYYSSVPLMPARNFIETFVLQIGKELHGDNCRIIMLDSNTNDFLELQKKNLLRLPNEKATHIDFLSMRYELENKLLSSIAAGNHKLALKLIKEANDFLALSRPRIPNKLRDHKNYTISFISLIRKTMELKGIHPIYLDEASSNFICETEQCANIEQLQLLVKKITTSFCTIAQEHQHKSHSPLVDTILTYVDVDLSSDLTLNTFAQNLNVNASYLSSLFSKEMGMPLTDYVTMKRMDRAKYLLSLTDCSIKSVAEQCGYSDIYYFSRIFKKQIGISPKVFHNSFYKEDHDIIKRLIQ